MSLELVKCSNKHVSIDEKVNQYETKSSSSKKVFGCDKCDYTWFKDITLKNM